MILLVRKRRFWAPGAKFHITSRGIRKMDLFLDDYDRLEYLQLLTEVKQRYPFKLHTYCLMTNHIHLQMETIDHSPSEIMKHLHTKYAKYFNKRYDYTGHVFESRYGDEIIDTPEYELEVSKYIHLNPLRANIVKHLEEYPWSSYHSYRFGEENPLVTTEKIFSYFYPPYASNYENYLNTDYSKLTFFPNGKLNTAITSTKPPYQVIKGW